MTPTILAKTTEQGKVEVEKIKMSEEDIEEAFTCTLTAKASERTTKGEEPSNPNIEIAYTYDATSCVTGEESSCVETTCYKNKTSDSCPAGTIFKTNAYTGCNSTTCTLNKYTLGEKNTKARMVTIQELALLGCSDVHNSCPIWVSNYLESSIEYGGTVNDATHVKKLWILDNGST